MTESIVKWRGLSHRYQSSTSPDVELRYPDYDLQPSTKLVVSGPSGCGKSTLLLILGGLLIPHYGEVALMGLSWLEVSDEKRRKVRRGPLAMIGQDDLFPELSALENITIAHVLRGLTAQHAEAIAQKALKSFGFTDQQMSAHPPELSSGQRQRTSIARAVSLRPAVLLADEPTSFLDFENTEIVCEALFADPDLTLVVATHDSHVARYGTSELSLAAI